ncbi:hypothetical protein fHeYen902_245 [Yersinia phage fHe-Yen9-02]|nr:hypothetical protein fHeYen902_245 [Yersinia phage fHe-Yen9-02]
MSGLFQHSTIEYKPGFVFIVAPSDFTSEDAIAAAASVSDLLAESWPSAPSQLTVEECRDEESAELILFDANQILEEAEDPMADCLVISSVTVIGDMCLVQCSLNEEGDDADTEDEEEDEDADWE